MGQINPVAMGPNDGGAENEFDFSKAEQAIRDLLIAIGEDPTREGLKDRKSTRLNSSH